MKKMTPEELAFAFEVLADEKHHSSVFRASERIRQHVVALESDVAQARERALEEAAERCDAMANMADGHSPVSASADRACADAVRALKSKPAQEASPDTTGEADQPLPCGPIEMASEENGLLPKRRRREHEYGEEKRSQFGTLVAPCFRPGCKAFRVKNRDGTRTAFKQSRRELATDDPGPCEVEP